jgi:alpha-glucuronidase
MARDHHYGPGPWVTGGPRTDWTSVYYHRADSNGIGFERTATGSNAVAQYFPPVAEAFSSLKQCPEEYLLWFHHVSWDYRMRSGRTLREELCRHYQSGVDTVRRMQAVWKSRERQIDAERYEEVRVFLKIQEAEARWWRDACLVYLQTFSNKPIPKECEQPAETLDYYESIVKRYVPGTARPIR